MMSRIVLAFPLLVVGLAVSGAFGQDQQVREDAVAALKHGWGLNYDEARRQARKTNRPLMVVFRCVP
jgi:hypothetical protein